MSSENFQVLVMLNNVSFTQAADTVKMKQSKMFRSADPYRFFCCAFVVLFFAISNAFGFIFAISNAFSQFASVLLGVVFLVYVVVETEAASLGVQVLQITLLIDACS